LGDLYRDELMDTLLYCESANFWYKSAVVRELWRDRSSGSGLIGPGARFWGSLAENGIYLEDWFLDGPGGRRLSDCLHAEGAGTTRCQDWFLDGPGGRRLSDCLHAEGVGTTRCLLELPSNRNSFPLNHRRLSGGGEIEKMRKVWQYERVVAKDSGLRKGLPTPKVVPIDAVPALALRSAYRPPLHPSAVGGLPGFAKNVDAVSVGNSSRGLADLAPYSARSVSAKVSTWQSNQIIAGWAFVTPYSSRLRFSAVGKVDIALLVVFSAGLGSIFSAVNYVITYRCVSAPAFKNRRELRSFFADSLLVGSRMMLAANPALLIAIVFLLCDRHLGTSIFDFSGGGDVVLFQHLFWFFGHPEVYIIVIPCFGFANSLLPHLFRKRLSGRLSLQYSMYTIGFMGFAVWGHHMYMVGLANTTRTLYSTMTVMISVPASTKVLHWCVTMVNSAPKLDVPLLFLLAFTYFFTLGGLSGMFSAHIGFDVSLHDTFYVIGHFHVMLAGAAVSCIFAAFYFYYSAIFGVRYSKILATLHFVFYFFGQLFTVIPMIWLGYAGMPRRIMDYPAYYGG
jgi:hypothetical protein